MNTPTPSELVQQWREEAEGLVRVINSCERPAWMRHGLNEQRRQLDVCADELEAALADALPPTVGPSYAELARVAAWGVRAEVREHHCCSWTIATCSGGDDRDECAACWFAYLAQRPLPEEAPDGN